MYQELAIMAMLVFIYSIIAGRINKSILSGPIIFVVTGLLLSLFVFDDLVIGPVRNQLHILADLSLALILFIDASSANLRTLRKNFQIPVRLLFLGLPGAIALGSLAALLLFDQLSVWEACLLGTMLAATDAALGKAVVTNPLVPARIREGLNFESGLNDGLCVPILLLFILLAEGNGGEADVTSQAVKLVVEELGIGIAVGVGLTGLGVVLVHWCQKRGWVEKIWIQVTVVALAIACFALAQTLHGSGYIAAFTGGLMFGYLAGKSTHDFVLAAEGTGEVLAMLTWLLFGFAIIGNSFELFTWPVIIYSALSLTVIRMVPVYLSLTGTPEPRREKLFLGWFGPRGLASIVFAVLVLNSDVPEADFLSLVVICTVFMSLVLHGVTANPLARKLAALSGRKSSETNTGQAD